MSSTVKKGDAFEKKAFELLKRLVENEEFFVPGKKSKVFWKKGYYSEKRKSEIVFDISIETFLNNAEKYSTLTLIECKNLGRKVTVDDVAEFESNISQVGEHNTKGVFISNSSFQESAYQLAINNGIGIIRLASNEEYEWISYRKPKYIAPIYGQELVSAFTTERLNERNLIAIINDHPVYNLSDVLIEAKVIDFYSHKERFIKFPYVTEHKIEEIIKRLHKHNVYENDRLNTDKLCKVLSEAYKMEFDFDSILPNQLLGKIDFDPLKIFVTSSLQNEKHRWRFTLAHEIGHLILHSPLLRYSIDEKIDTDSSLSLDSNITDETSKQVEFQANLFARHLLMPNDIIIKVVLKYFKQEDIHKGFLFLDNQPRNRALVFSLLNQMSLHFEVSVEAAKVRLKALGLIKDATDNSMFSHLKNMGYR